MHDSSGLNPLTILASCQQAIQWPGSRSRHRRLFSENVNSGMLDGRREIARGSVTGYFNEGADAKFGIRMLRPHEYPGRFVLEKSDPVLRCVIRDDSCEVYGRFRLGLIRGERPNLIHLGKNRGRVMLAGRLS